MSKPKFCPLAFVDGKGRAICVEKECAWWDNDYPDGGDCAILKIAFSLEGIEEQGRRDE